MSVILAQCTSPGCAARYREILAGQVDQAAINRRASGNHAIGGEIFVCHAKVCGTMLRKQTNLLEAFMIDQLVDAFPRGELTRLVLFLDALFAATLLDLRLFLAKFGGSLFHGRTRRFECCCRHVGPPWHRSEI